MDVIKAYKDICAKAYRKGAFVRFHTAQPRKTPVVAKILAKAGLLQECSSVVAPNGEVFGYASSGSFECQVPLHSFIALSQSRFAKFLEVSVFKPYTATVHDAWQVSFVQPENSLVTYKLSELIFTEDDED